MIKNITAKLLGHGSVNSQDHYASLLKSHDNQNHPIPIDNDDLNSYQLVDTDCLEMYPNNFTERPPEYSNLSNS